MDRKTYSSSFDVGQPADFQVIDWQKAIDLCERFDRTSGAEDLLFALLWYWQSHMTTDVYIGGKVAHQI
jgi:hypothetical protein